jgi:hypothetical protein
MGKSHPVGSRINHPPPAATPRLQLVPTRLRF